MKPLGQGAPRLESLFAPEGPQRGQGPPSPSSLALRAGRLPCSLTRARLHSGSRASPREGARRRLPEAGLLLSILPLSVLQRPLLSDLGQGLPDSHQPDTQEPLLPRACLAAGVLTALGAQVTGQGAPALPPFQASAGSWLRPTLAFESAMDVYHSASKAASGGQAAVPKDRQPLLPQSPFSSCRGLCCPCGGVPLVQDLHLVLGLGAGELQGAGCGLSTDTGALGPGVRDFLGLGSGGQAGLSAQVAAPWRLGQ